MLGLLFFQRDIEFCAASFDQFFLKNIGVLSSKEYNQKKKHILIFLSLSLFDQFGIIKTREVSNLSLVRFKCGEKTHLREHSLVI